MAVGDLTFIQNIALPSGVRGCLVDPSPGYKIMFGFTQARVLYSWRYSSNGATVPLHSVISSGGTTGTGIAIDIINKVIVTSEFNRIRAWSYDSNGILTPGGTASASQAICVSVEPSTRTAFRGGGSSGFALATYLADGSGFSATGSYYNTVGSARYSAADSGRGFVFLNDFNNGLMAFSYSGIAVPVPINTIAGNVELAGYQAMVIDTVNRLVFSGDDTNGLISNIYNGSTGVISQVQNIPTPSPSIRNSRGVAIDLTAKLVFIGVDGVASYMYDLAGIMTPVDVIYTSGNPNVDAIAIDTEWFILFESNQDGVNGIRVLSYEFLNTFAIYRRRRYLASSGL